MFEDFEEPLPEWAVRRSKGNYMEVGAQLCTRDGRRLGNAYVRHVRFSELQQMPVADIVTDSGNKATLNLSELKSAFYPPEYVMCVVQARWRLRDDEEPKNYQAP